MALVTLGTAATTTLSAVRWNQAAAPADLAALSALIKYQDGIPSAPKYQPIPVVTSQGLIFWSDRGALKLFPGDYIGVDPNTGQWILLTAATAAAASWVHT